MATIIYKTADKIRTYVINFLGRILDFFGFKRKAMALFSWDPGNDYTSFWGAITLF